MTGGSRPPRWLTALATWSVPRRDRPSVRGDLAESFARRAERSGGRAARRWYLRQALGMAVQVPAARFATAVARSSAGFVHGVGTAARGLVRRPAFAVPVLLIFAVTISANALVFSIVDAVLIEPLPYPAPERLAMIWDVDAQNPSRVMPIQYRHYEAWQGREDLFDAVGAFESVRPVVRVGDRSERVNGISVSAGAWSAFGVTPHLGRLFTEEDDRAGAPPVVVVSHGFWQSRLGGAPEAVGSTIVLDGQRARVVAVMPEGFLFYDPYMFTRSSGARENAETDVWTPLHSDRDWASDGWRDYPALRVLVRLREGVSLDVARSAALALRAGLGEADSETTWRADLTPLSEQVTASSRRELILAVATAALVLLVACINIVGLVLARDTSRRGELAARMALGATRWQIGRMVVWECVLLALAGGALGLLAGEALLSTVVAMTPRDLPMVHRIDVGPRVVLATLGMGVLAGLVTGIPAALRGGRLQSALSTLGRSVAQDRTGARMRAVVLAAQVSITLVLLVPAVAMVREFAGLATADLGFHADGVTTFQSVPVLEDGDLDGARLFHEELARRLADIPGVLSVGGVSSVPFGEWFTPGAVLLPEQAGEPAEPLRLRLQRTIPGYLETLGIPLVSGRRLGPGDVTGSEPVALVSESFHRQLQTRSPGSESLVLVGAGPDRTDVSLQVVGVVADVVHRRDTGPGEPVVYVSQAQFPGAPMQFVIRAEVGRADLVRSIRDVAAGVDPSQPLHRFDGLDNLVAQSLHRERSLAEMLGLLSAIALVLAAVGIYGTVSHTLAMRRPEMGLRKAFGARDGLLLSLTLGGGLRPVAAGAAVGWLGAMALRRSVVGLVGEVPPPDALSQGLALGVLALAALLAVLGPARAAVAVDPAEILRGE